jgi:hypothetical protein
VRRLQHALEVRGKALRQGEVLGQPFKGHRPFPFAVLGAMRLERLAEYLPLSQRFPSHLQRVLQPAHEMLLAGGIVTKARFVQDGRSWRVEYH